MTELEFSSSLKDSWLRLFSVHNVTKGLYILSEEFSVGLMDFLQPIKEMRDAHEHVIRAQGAFYERGVNLSDEEKKYILKNLEKALSHEYRAYFDTVDFLCIIFRNGIVEFLKGFSYLQIINVWPEYEKTKNDIIDYSESIAKIRENKDVGNAEEMESLMQRYYKITMSLFEIYKNISKNVIHKLNVKFKKLDS